MAAHTLVGPEGFEPTTLGSEDRISANLKLLLPSNVKHGLSPILDSQVPRPIPILIDKVSKGLLDLTNAMADGEWLTVPAPGQDEISETIFPGPGLVVHLYRGDAVGRGRGQRECWLHQFRP